MSPQLAQVMTAAEGRYLTAAEIESVKNIMQTYDSRMTFMQEIEKHEDYIIKTTIDRVFEKFPQFQQERPNAYDKCVRDESLVLRYAVLAYINDNPEIFTEKVMFWMRTIVESMGFADVAKFTYVTMQDCITEKISSDDAVELNKLLQMMVDCLDS